MVLAFGVALAGGPGIGTGATVAAVGIAPLLLWGVACSAAYQAQPLDETDGGVFADASVQDASTGTDGSTPPRTDGGGTMDGGAPVVDRCSGVTCKENARCDGATGGCRCIPGFTADGSGACIAPATRFVSRPPSNRASVGMLSMPAVSMWSTMRATSCRRARWAMW